MKIRFRASLSFVFSHLFVFGIHSYFIFTTTDEQTKSGGFQYVLKASDFLEAVGFFASWGFLLPSKIIKTAA